ncbi:MAG: hypothetical protein H6560_18465 [Lewinellaceae bacterium]|nr:hypothetical protein [Lewinellaceae bacterium]
MDFLWDTNILVHYIRESNLYNQMDEQYGFLGPSNRVFLSIVSIGEIYSLAKQRQWGVKKMKQLENTLQAIHPLAIAKKTSFKRMLKLMLIVRTNYPGDPCRKECPPGIWVKTTFGLLQLRM